MTTLPAADADVPGTIGAASSPPSPSPDPAGGPGGPPRAPRPGTRMRAVVQDRYGGPDVLRPGAAPVPAIAADEVLVEVAAAGVDRGTEHLMTGLPYVVRLAGYGVTGPKQRVPGLDVAGRVVAVGDAVTRFRPGDAVFGIAKGSYAEYAAAVESKLAHTPAGLSAERAGVAAVSGITALQAVEDVGDVRAGQSVLVLGASGGVGTYAVQLARACGAEVTGVCSAAKADLVRSIGADRVVDYASTDVTCEDRTYDVIVDVGGRRPLRALRRILRPAGTLVIVGGEDGNRVTGGAGRQLRALLLSPFVGQRLTTFVSREHFTLIERLAAHLAAGTVVPVVDRALPLDGVSEALRLLGDGRVTGKVAITVGADIGADPGRAA